MKVRHKIQCLRNGIVQVKRRNGRRYDLSV
jgi:hypothetical protein